MMVCTCGCQSTPSCAAAAPEPAIAMVDRAEVFHRCREKSRQPGRVIRAASAAYVARDRLWRDRTAESIPAAPTQLRIAHRKHFVSVCECGNLVTRDCHENAGSRDIPATFGK